MFTRPSLFAAALPALVLSVSALRAADVWMTDFEKAKAAAAKDNKDILMDFTGSDWCPACILLHSQVFEKDAFKQDAAKNFVFMEVDFPEQKKLPEATQTQNKKLQLEYGINEYPTVILADAQGRPYAVAGYEKGGPANYLGRLAELRKKKDARDAALKKAAAASGVEKAKLTIGALKGLRQEWIFTHYKKEIEEAIAADPDDASGVKKSRDEFAGEAEFAAKTDKLYESLAPLHDAGKFQEFRDRIDQFIAGEKLTGRRKQELLFAKLSACGEDLKLADKLLDDVIAVDPESDFAGQAKQIREDLKKAAADPKQPDKETDNEDPAENKAPDPAPQEDKADNK